MLFSSYYRIKKLSSQVLGIISFVMLKISTPILLVLLLLIGTYELYLRLTSGYFTPLIYTFKDNIGFVYDHFAAPNVVNAFGFVDKDRNPNINDRKRVLIVGDSFVSGTSLAEQIERNLNKAIPEEHFEVIPMGFPGIGLGNMYSFVEQYGLLFKPVAVVAIFNSSTLANNSRLLESIKLGSHPDHSMRLFFEEDNGQCHKMPIDSNFQQYFLKELPARQSNTLYTEIDNFLKSTIGRLYVFSWLNDIVMSRDQYAFLSRDNEFAYRYYQLRSTPSFNQQLSDWLFPADLDINNMFWISTEELPVVFRSALNSTKCAFIEFDKLASANDFKFIVAISDDCSAQNSLQKSEFQYRSDKTQRHFIDQGYKNKVAAIAEETGTKHIDLFDAFRINQDAFHQYQNIHWNEEGIKIAAFSISKYIVSTLSVNQAP